MKRLYNIIGIALLVMLVASCGNNSGKTFQPKERKSSLTASQRELALDKKRAELEIQLDSLLYSHGVKFSILKPKVDGEDITEDVSNALAIKMLEIASQNGISGLGTSPSFVLGVEIAQTGWKVTGTAPQKMMVDYDLTFKVMNTATGDVFGTATQQITGVGNSFEEANRNAMNSVKSTPQLQKMLQTASERIISWYNANLPALRRQVAKAEGEGKYDLAAAILSSVPDQAKAASQWASSRLPATMKAMQHQHAADMLGQLEGAIASANNEYSPEIAAYLRLIPTDTPEYVKAQQAFDAYNKRCEARITALEAKAERDAQSERELAKWREQKEHEKEMAQIEADKITAKYQAKANAAATERAMRYDSDQRRKGFWGKLGDRILGGIDAMGEKISDATDD